MLGMAVQTVLVYFLNLSKKKTPSLLCLRFKHQWPLRNLQFLSLICFRQRISFQGWIHRVITLKKKKKKVSHLKWLNHQNSYKRFDICIRFTFQKDDSKSSSIWKSNNNKREIIFKTNHWTPYPNFITHHD